MKTRKNLPIYSHILVAILSSFLWHIASADEGLPLDDVRVTANRLNQFERDATYATAVYFADEIAHSGATTLYEFLAQNTALNVLPSFGNKLMPSIKLRGVGNSGIVLTLDGQRLNNIDGLNQLLSTVSLAEIERIEIAAGSGSVVDGDGAMAGVIHLYTKPTVHNLFKIGTTFGDYGQSNQTIQAGFSQDRLALSVGLAHDAGDGTSQQDSKGNTNNYFNNTLQTKLHFKASDTLGLFVSGFNSNNDVRYVNALSLAQFSADPSQSKAGGIYNHQRLLSQQWRAGLNYALSERWAIEGVHGQENKHSAYLEPFPFSSDYRYYTNDVSLKYQGEQLEGILGVQTFDGVRFGSNNTTEKNNQGVFLQTKYHPDWLSSALTNTLGVRFERVVYRYQSSAKLLERQNTLLAWDWGVNYRFNEQWSGFYNYNRAFRNPDIDSFFNYDGTFNGFVTPETASTHNLGVFCACSPQHQFKLTTFYMRFHNEIYFNPTLPPFGVNTNIDRTHRYGLSVTDTLKPFSHWEAKIAYDYTRALIDENSNWTASNGKNLPNVPRQIVALNIAYQPLEHTQMILSHTWRESTYASDDWLNQFSQKQASYQITNLAVHYQYKQAKFFAVINNLFNQSNALQIRNDVIYPIDFVRTFRVGMNLEF